MTMIKSGLGLAGLVAVAALTAGSSARAEEAREFAWSTTIGATSDYVFRGFTQTKEDPAFQMSIDASYGIFYAGVWGTNLDLDTPGSTFGSAEIDFYTGIKPVLGPVTFDLGVIYYYYPGSDDPDGLDANLGNDESDYVEFKIGASMTPFTNASLSAAYYYSPDNFGEVGDNHAIEGTVGYTLPAFHIFTPTISGTLGYVKGDEDDDDFGGFGDDADDHYTHWNAGLALAVEKFTFDFRYHDTDISDDVVCEDNCDERFVFTAKITLP